MPMAGSALDLLTMPDEVERRPRAWEGLTRGDLLYQALRAAVRGDAIVDWAGLLSAASRWRDDFLLYRPSGDRRQRDLRRWDQVHRLIVSAAMAARGAPPTGGVRREVADDGWMLTFRDAAVVGRPVRVAVALLDDRQEAAFLVGLELDALEGGDGEPFLHPAHAFTTDLDEDFAASLRDAWQVALGLARVVCPGLPNASGRYRLTSDGRPLPRIKGRSAGAAAARGWLHALNGKIPDDRVIVSADIAPQEGGGSHTLRGVLGIPEKVRAIAAAGTFDSIAVAGARDRLEAERVLDDSGQRDRIRVVDLDAPRLESLIGLRSWLADDVEGYLRDLVEAHEGTPWYRDGRPIHAIEVAIPARVLKEETRIPGQPRPEGEDRPDPSAGEFERRERNHELDDPETAALYEEPQGRRRRLEVSWAAEQPQCDRVVILGAPGGGKSFLLGTTAAGLARESLRRLEERNTALDDLPLPLHLELNDLAAAGAEALEDALLEAIGMKRALTRRLGDWMRAGLWSPRCLLVLDALDQVEERDRRRLRSRLRSLDAVGRGCRLLLTCRTANYDRAVIPWERVTEYELAPFRPRDVQALIERWFGPGDPRGRALSHALARNLGLAHACRNPLIATLTCLAHEVRGVTEETRPTDLYGPVLRHLAARTWQADPLDPHNPHVDDLLRLLEPVARRLFELRPEGNQFAHAEILEAIGGVHSLPLPLTLRERAPDPALDGQVLAHAPVLLRDELCECGILVNAGLGPGDELQFSLLHRSFLEYLTAMDYAREADRSWEALAPAIGKWAWLPAWQEVVVFLAGRLRAPVPLLTMLADNADDDVFRHRLGLAVRCLGELGTEARSSHRAVAQDLASRLFALWWTHLRRGNQAAVAHLGRALPVVARVNPESNGRPLLDSLLAKLSLTGNIFSFSDDSRGAVERESALETLILMRPQLSEVGVLDRLLELLGHKDTEVRASTLTLLAQAGLAEVPPTLLGRVEGLLGDPESRVRWAAIKALVGLGAHALSPASVERFMEMLAEVGHGVDLSEYGTLAEFAGLVLAGADDSVKEPFLARLAEFLRREGRSAALWVVQRLGPDAASPEVESQLKRLLRSSDSDNEPWEALIALGRMGRLEATPALTDQVTTWIAMNSTPGRRMRDVLGALIEFSPLPPQLLYGVAKLLGSDVAGEVERAVDAVETLGRLADQPVIREAAAAMGSPLLRLRVQRAIGLIDSKEAARKLLDYGRSLTTGGAVPSWEDHVQRFLTIEEFGKVGPAAAIPEVIQWLEELLGQVEDFSTAPRVIQALGELGPAAATHGVIRRMVELLLRGSRSGSFGMQMQKEVEKALEELSPVAVKPDVVDELKSSLDSEDWYEQQRGLIAIKGLNAVAASPAISARFRALFEGENGPKVAEILRGLMDGGYRIVADGQGCWSARTVSDLSR
jgi:HEAT repeat protein